MRRFGPPSCRQWRWALVAAGTAALVGIPAFADRAGRRRRPDVDVSSWRARILHSAAQPYQGYAEGHGGLPPPRAAGRGRPVHTDQRHVPHPHLVFAGRTAGAPTSCTPGGERDRYRDTRPACGCGTRASTRSTFVHGDTQLRLPIPTDVTPPDLARRIARCGHAVRAQRARAQADRRARRRRLPDRPGLAVSTIGQDRPLGRHGDRRCRCGSR